MKHAKKIVSFLLAAILVLTMSVSAFADTTGYTITVTNSNKAVSIVGKEYNAYKIFDVTYSEDKKAYAYTVADAFKGFNYDGKTGDDLIAAVGAMNDNPDALNAFAEAALKYVTDNKIASSGSAAGAVAGDKEQAVISVPSAGYYLVAGNTLTTNNQKVVVAACSLTTADPTADVIVKADAPSIDKKIDANKNGSYDEKDVAANQGAIGDVVPFVVKSAVPDMTGYEKYYFVINDTLSEGLTFNNDVVVKIGDTTLATSAFDVITEGSSFKVVLKDFISYKAQKGAAIIVTYSATINDKAALGSAGNTNTVTLTYSDNPNVADEGTSDKPDLPTGSSPVGQTPESQTKTYVTGIKLTKVNEEGRTLAGAKFKIEGESLNITKINSEIFRESANGTYYRLKNGTYTKTAPNNNDALYDSTTVKYEKVETVTTNTTAENIVREGWVDASGVLSFTGLAAGTYTITELVAPDGYNKLKAPITVTINWDGTQTTVWSAVIGDKAADYDNTLGVVTVNVVNSHGALLPTTGSTGTTLFYVIGAVMILGAALILVSKKRMSLGR
ncbi:MAG: isopeptide-forming domain-containing fimbrial protein [Lachnospiraceae bacterium]|nr:isopeptide-forming domain-containing fimbrial protein [Lachnospiraceae bacterium]